MKPKSYMGIVAVFSLIAIFLGINSINPTLGARADLLVEKLKNDVRVKKATSEEWQDAQLKMALSIGDSIKTGDNSFASWRTRPDDRTDMHPTRDIPPLSI